MKKESMRIIADGFFSEIQILFQKKKPQFAVLKKYRTKEIGQVKYPPKISFFYMFLQY